MILLEEIVSLVHAVFIKFVIKNKIKTDLEYIYDEDLNYLIEDTIKESLSREFDLEKEEMILTFLSEIAMNDEIHGIIFLTDRGDIIYSSLENIHNFLKEVDFRVKICNNSILKLFYTSKNKELIFSESIEDLYLVILIFDSKTRFGIAELYLHKVVKKILEILHN